MKTLTEITSGTIDEDLRYTAFMAVGVQKDSRIGPELSASPDSIIYRVELPFVTKIHLLGVPKNPLIERIQPTLGYNSMEYVDLEGDFYKYFDLYTDKGKQIQARYIMDPKAMAFVIDFCMSHSWELINDELYFVQPIGAHHKGSQTSIHKNVSLFVKEIRPAVEEKSPRVLKKIHKKSSPVYRCPRCSKKMSSEKHWFLCPAEHGVLVPGKELIALRKSKLATPRTLDRGHFAGHGDIACPVCKVPMSAQTFPGTDVIIDVCYNCHHRWIDAEELESLAL